jgi:outer membrane protein OmpA-like peptidoglycan-associated protein
MKTLITFITCTILIIASAQQTVPIEVTVLNDLNKPYTGDKIFFLGQTKKKTYSGVTDSKGKFLIQLPAGDVYDIKIMSIGDELEYNTLEIPTLNPGEFFEKMELTIIYNAATTYDLSNLQFESGKSVIKPESFALLTDLIEIMKLKGSMMIEIAGHTDSDGDADANLLLSKQRADAVKSHLISKGIRSERIKTIGYGESRPVADNATIQGKAMNRRTEIRVL